MRVRNADIMLVYLLVFASMWYDWFSFVFPSCLGALRSCVALLVGHYRTV
jgi:hypothetical protein